MTTLPDRFAVPLKCNDFFPFQGGVVGAYCWLKQGHRGPHEGHDDREWFRWRKVRGEREVVE